MPRLSLWQDGKHSNDYKFLDRRISEMFTIGGTGILVNKYLGTTEQTGSTDATRPEYLNQSEKNIQDLLWLENRDRKYSQDVYKMRGIYQRADQDFDLSQFGLFLQTGTIFMVFHLRDMVDTLGRKLISGDVLELQHLKDYDALDQDLPAALKRYYVVSDASFAAEGFTPTWWPHLWRVKLNPLVDSQEYKDILDRISAGPATDTPVSQVLSTYQKFIDINQQVVAQAEIDVPKSGYDTSGLYTLPTDGDNPTVNSNPLRDGITADQTTPTADNSVTTADTGLTGRSSTPGADGKNVSPESKIQGYLTGDGLAPNRIVTGAGISFPADPVSGDYFLRLDYLPNRLFRYNGNFWARIEDNVRTNVTPGAGNNQTQRSGYVNNTNTFTDAQGQTHDELQPLSRILTPKADN